MPGEPQADGTTLSGTGAVTAAAKTVEASQWYAPSSSYADRPQSEVVDGFCF